MADTTLKRNKSFIAGFWIGLCILLVPVVLCSSCSGDKKKMAAAIVNDSLVPMMNSEGVSTLISDSGVIRYKIIAEEWNIYDKLDTSRWTFEKGLYLEKYDNQMHIDAKIKADTAYYYDKIKLWELRGHVDIMNSKGEKFNTSLLYWDEIRQTVYSDRFIRIQQTEKILTGYGFNSNQQFTDYLIHNTAGVFPVEDNPQDSIARDSAPHP